MDRKIIGMGIGAVLVISLIAIMGFAFAQDSTTTTHTTGFVDADGDGVCDNVANCPRHTATDGCNGGCERHSAGFTGGCHRASTD